MASVFELDKLMNTKMLFQNSFARTIFMMGSLMISAVALAAPSAIGPDFTVRVNVGDAYTDTSNRTDLWPKFEENPPLLDDPCRNRCTYAGSAVSGANIISLDNTITGFGDGWFHPLDVDGLSPYSSPGTQTFEVRATLIADGSTSANFVTAIVIVNGAPAITSNGAGAAALIDVDEGTAEVTTVVATDINLPDDNLTYSISGGADAGSFVINGVSGKLDFTGAPDFESAGDVDADNIYEVEVTVTDVGNDSGTALTDTQILTVTVKDVNDIAPVITSGTLFNINENVSEVVTVAVTDADTVGVTSYSIVGGVDSDDFSIDAGTGALTFAVVPDFDNPADSDLDNSYFVDIQVDNGPFSIGQSITVNILNLDTNPTAEDATLNVDEDATYSFKRLDFSYDDVDGDAFSAIRLVSYPAKGQLSLSGAPLPGLPGFVLNVGQIENLTYDPIADDDGTSYASFRFGVRDSMGSESVADYTITFDVAGVADAPSVAVTSTISLNEDDSGLMGVNASLVDITNETLSVQISGLPVGAAIDDGVSNSTLAITDVSSWDLANIKVVPPRHSDVEFTLTVTATSTELNSADTAQNTATADIVITAVADVPGLTVGATTSGDEDTGIALSIAGTLVDSDGSETLTFQIAAAPIGALLNNGVDAGAGVWNLSAADVAGLTITPPANDDTDFSLSVTAITNDNDASVASSPVAAIAVTVTAVADVPTIIVTAAVSGDEDTSIPLTISGTVADTDGSETLGYRVSGVPTTATLSAGTNSGGGIWDLTAAEVTGLNISLNQHLGTDFQLQVQSSAIEARDGDVTASAASSPIDVTFNDVADLPTLSLTATASGNEDSPIALTVGGALVDVDGSESLSVTIAGVPAGATLNAGSDLGGGAWSVSSDDFAGLAVTPPTNSVTPFSLTAAAVATELSGGSTISSATQSISVTIVAVNDAPVVANQTFTLDENSPNGTVVGNVPASDVDVGQTLSFGLTGTAFTVSNSGIITVADVNELDFETTSTFTLTLTVTDDGAPTANDTATITINLNGVSDSAPIGVSDAATVDELATVVFNVLTNDSDPDVPADIISVSEVNNDAGLVGVPVDVIESGVVVGTLTIESNGDATFVATADSTVEIFSASATYSVGDGVASAEEIAVLITINPINDNSPSLSANGVALMASGIQFDEDQYASAGSPRFVVLNDLFIDLDIDEDGVLDGSVSGDNDSLGFTITSNSNSGLLSTAIASGDLSLYSAANEHGVSNIVIEAVDVAAPFGNISSVTLSLAIDVVSVNDPPIYSSSYSNSTQDEDSGDIPINLSNAFTDADLSDSDPSDETLTYRVTVDDVPNPFVTTTMIDTSGFTLESETIDVPAVGARRFVFTTTNTDTVLPINEDAHGYVDVTIRAIDLGRPPASPADAIPLFDDGSFRVTVNGIGDDTPMAVDDHYSDFPQLEINEDSDAITFNVTSNDDQGDAPVLVISAGQQIVDSFGGQHNWRTTSRLSDPNNTGDFTITINGEVSCAHIGCLSAETADTTIDGGAASNFDIVYKPSLDFSGEDSFVYCIEDTFPGSEAAFTPPSDPRCATVTVNVLPVNDKPIALDPIIFVMDQADDLMLGADDGLTTKIQDIDNTHVDGVGCNPAEPTCMPAPGDPQSDTLYFQLTSALTDHGQMLPPFTSDGGFHYRPDATFAGDDSFTFNVCDIPFPGDADHCVYGVTASIVIEPIEGAPTGSSGDAVEFDYQLAQIPLELPVGPEPNVLLVNDDSGSMGWDILTDQDSGLYYFSTGNYIYYTLKATAGSSTSVAPSESSAPNAGLWRLRNSTYNRIYYNPENQYQPWDGLDTSDNEFPDSPPASARHHPLSGSATTNLTIPQSYTGRAVVTQESCYLQCVSYSWSGCSSYETVCGTFSGFQNVNVTNYHIPRFYLWDDKDGDGLLDDVPSPFNDSANSEGMLVEIKPASDGGSDTYPKTADRTDCTTSETYCTYDEELQNFANWFTYARNREFTAKSALGRVVASAENIRIGYAKLNSSSGLKRIVSMNTSERTGAKAELLDAIYQTNSSGGTPLRRSLRDAGRYYECRSNDIFNSGSNSSPGSTNCPVLASPEGNCQQNFTLLITDGTWNGNDPGVGDSDDDNNTDFDGGAYAGSTNNTLADVAMHYYERDLHSLTNEVPTTARDRSGAPVDAFVDSSDEIMHQHMATYTVGFGVSGLIDAEPTDYTAGFNWGNPGSSSARKIDDLRHAAYNGRGEYLNAASAKELSNALISAFEEFAQGSGAASAVSFNSQEIQEDTLIFRAFYNTKINTGNLIAQSLTEAGLVDEPVWESAIAMDSVDPDDREIFTFDADLSRGIPFRPDAYPAGLTTAQRNTFVDDLGASSEQKNAEVTQRVNYLRGDSSLERPVGNFRERPTIEGRLGDIVHSTPVFVGEPNRLGRDGEPYPQGGDLYSYFRAANQDRQELIYVEANDGMLHGFDASNGSEVFGYVPNNLMLGTFSRKITDLLDYEYSHRFFVDLTPAVNDAFIKVDGTGDREWATVLIGGQGAGAKAYFALDVTDPDKLNEADAADVVLWEFTEADDSYPTDAMIEGDLADLGNALKTGTSLRMDLQDIPQTVRDLGNTFSVPTLAMSNVVTDGENEWIAIFGNGFNSTAGIAKLFVLFVERGADGNWCHPNKKHNVVENTTALPTGCSSTDVDFVKINTGFGVQGGLPNGLGTPRGIDVDSNGTIDFAYAGDTFGNFFRFDLRSDDYSDWKFIKIFEAEHEDSFGVKTPQPITTQPIVTQHPTEADGYIVIFATGSYITVPDGVTDDIQSIYGLWDRLTDFDIQMDTLVRQRYTNEYDATFGNVRSLSNEEVNYKGAARGWFNHLDTPALGFPITASPEFPGERAVRNIQIRGGLTFVNSIVPRSADSCVDVAGGFALSFCPGTGGTDCLGDRGIFDLNDDGSFDDGDKVNGTVVAGTRFEDAVPTDSSFIGDERITQLSDKSLDATGANVSQGRNTGRLSWKQRNAVD
ncbi:MAG: type IV pilus assembly protein PilY1 [Candidatus Azotimanducaceae bacterium]|jgi:type IV pilus assembly protein PilY1